jgi:hypothetical protein
LTTQHFAGKREHNPALAGKRDFPAAFSLTVGNVPMASTVRRADEVKSLCISVRLRN